MNFTSIYSFQLVFTLGASRLALPVLRLRLASLGSATVLVAAAFGRIDV